MSNKSHAHGSIFKPYDSSTLTHTIKIKRNSETLAYVIKQGWEEINYVVGIYFSKTYPTKINIAEVVNKTGQSLKGKKLTLNPVKRDTIARIINIPAEARNTKAVTILVASIRLTPKTIMPIKIKLIPSTIHSIAMMFLLSLVISPNSLTTDFVGKR